MVKYYETDKIALQNVLNIFVDIAIERSDHVSVYFRYVVAAFYNISAMSWWSVLLVVET